MKVKKTYRIEEETASELEQLSKAAGVTATVALERAIHAAIQCQQAGQADEKEKQAKKKEQSREGAALIKQLDAKDAQISALLEQLAAAQAVSASVAETAKAAQALHAQAVGGALAPVTEQQKSRWQRLKDAWRG